MEFSNERVTLKSAALSRMDHRADRSDFNLSLNRWGRRYITAVSIHIWVFIHHNELSSQQMLLILTYWAVTSYWRNWIWRISSRFSPYLMNAELMVLVRKMGFILNESLPRRLLGNTDKSIPKSLNAICVIYSGLWNSLCNSICVTNLNYAFLLLILLQIQDGSWHQSRFFFYTQDSRQLPIVDIQRLPTLQHNSQRHIEIGPVCFFWHEHHCGVNLCTRTT